MSRAYRIGLAVLAGMEAANPRRSAGDALGSAQSELAAIGAVASPTTIFNRDRSKLNPPYTISESELALLDKDTTGL